jgi:hypothetical protein
MVLRPMLVSTAPSARSSFPSLTVDVEATIQFGEDADTPARPVTFYNRKSTSALPESAPSFC